MKGTPKMRSCFVGTVNITVAEPALCDRTARDEVTMTEDLGQAQVRHLLEELVRLFW